MPYKSYVLIVLSLITLLSCSKVPEEEFYLIQKGKVFSADEVSISREPFTIVSKHKNYSFVLALKPIWMLADHKEIVKLEGTGEAWEKGDAPLYKESALLNDDDACYAYFGNLGEGCQTYVKKKIAQGFRRHSAYTFGVYYPNEQEWRVEKIGQDNIKETKAMHYYLYLFKEGEKLGEVARAQFVTRIKINIR